MTPLSLSAMWHCVLATFQTRHDINNDARQHPDTNFSLLLCFLCLKNLLNSRYVSGGVESAKPRSHEWKNHHICVMHACMSTQHVRLKLFIYFYIFYPLSAAAVFTLKPEHLFFPVIYFISNIKKWHDERLAIILQCRNIKCMHGTFLNYLSEKCFHNKEK